MPYFIAEESGVFSRTKVFVTDLGRNSCGNPRTQSYDGRTIPDIARDAPDNSLSLLTISFFPRPSHVSPEYAGPFLHPIVGWTSGIELDEIGSKKAATINGSTGEFSTDKVTVFTPKSHWVKWQESES
jgi:hypothetical protein